MSATPGTPSKKESLTSTNETPAQRVLQPKKLQSPELLQFSELVNLIGDIDNVVAKRVREEFPVTTSGGAQTPAISVREQMLANLPKPAVMQRELTRHIHKEIASLRRKTRRIARVKGIGWAYELTLIYARIRRLTGIAKSIVSASIDALKKFYVHVFIDRQSLETPQSATPPAR